MRLPNWRAAEAYAGAKPGLEPQKTQSDVIMFLFSEEWPDHFA